MRLTITIKVFFSLMTCFAASGQSLISNGSFEKLSSCPRGIGSIECATDWYMILETPDLFSECAGKGRSVSVPYNYMGYTLAQDGASYAGLALYYIQNGLPLRKCYNKEESIYRELSQKTEAGKVYEFSIWTCLADSANFYTNQFSITLTADEPTAYGKMPYKQVVPVKIANPRSKEWNKSTVSFKATSNWKFITLGYSRDLLSLVEYKKFLKKNLVLAKKSYGRGTCYYYFDGAEMIQRTSGTSE